MPTQFAIVGCGHVAGRHAAAIQQVGKLVAVCDPDPPRAAQLASAYQCRAFNSIGEMLAATNPSIVTICSPSGLHPGHVTECLDAGIHVLCEKPLAIDSETAAKLVKKAQDSGKKLFVVKQNRYNQPVAIAKNLLDGGALGKVHGFQITCNWQRGPEYFEQSPWRGKKIESGGILFTQFSHFIDLLYWFLGDLKEAKGWRANVMHKSCIDFEDTGSATLLMENGAIGALYYTINAQPRNLEGSFTLFGSKGTVRIGGEYLNRIDHLWLSDGSTPDFNTISLQENNHVKVYREMIKALEDTSCNVVEAAEAMKSIKIIEQIYLSSPMLS